MRHPAVHLVSSNAADLGTNFAVTQPQAVNVIPAGMCTGSFNASMQNVESLRNFSYQVQTNDVVGSWAIYGNCEPGANTLGPIVNGSNGITSTWILIGSSEGEGVAQAVSGSTANMVNLWNQAFKWAQFQFTYTSGQQGSAVDVWFNGKDF